MANKTPLGEIKRVDPRSSRSSRSACVSWA